MSNIDCILLELFVYQQLWEYKVEEKLRLGVCKKKNLNTTAILDT
jgi:hypothetical protein